MMKRLLALCMLLVFLTGYADRCNAQAAQAVTGAQNAIGGVVRNVLIKRGFAANDPRFASTFSAMSSAFAGYATGAVLVVGAAVTAPAWLTVAVAALGVPLALWAGDQAAKWLWDKNNPKNVTVSAPVTAPNTDPIKPTGQDYWTASASGKVLVGGNDPQAVGQQFASLMGNGFRIVYPCTGGGTSYQCIAYQWDSVNGKWGTQASFAVNKNQGFAGISCGGGMYVDSTGGCHAYDAVPTGYNGIPRPINDAVAEIPGLNMGKPLNPQVMTNAINNVWKDISAKPGYSGIPYDYANPVTVSDVETWANEHPDVWPKVQDWTKPQDPVTKPWTIPNTTSPVTSYDPATNPATGSNPAGASQPQLNLGSDPGIPFPQIEDAPSADSILQPILNLLPDLKNFQAQSFSGECPKPTFEAFEHSFTIDKHCDFSEQNRGAIRAGMMVVFALASLIIVLRA